MVRVLREKYWRGESCRDRLRERERALQTFLRVWDLQLTSQSRGKKPPKGSNQNNPLSTERARNCWNSHQPHGGGGWVGYPEEYLLLHQ